MSSLILTVGTINSSRREHFAGFSEDSISGTADYGNTTSSWNSGDKNLLNHISGNDPAVETVKWGSWTRNAGWNNVRIGGVSGYYMTGEIISGCSFDWRTYPNQDGGIALNFWGIGIENDSGTKKRWASAELNSWSTSSSFRTISTNFSGDLQSKLNSGYRFTELHFMFHTPANKGTPGAESILEIKNFKFRYKASNNAIIPGFRFHHNRADYPLTHY